MPSSSSASSIGCESGRNGGGSAPATTVSRLIWMARAGSGCVPNSQIAYTAFNDGYAEGRRRHLHHRSPCRGLQLIALALPNQCQRARRLLAAVPKGIEFR